MCKQWNELVDEHLVTLCAYRALLVVTSRMRTASDAQSGKTRDSAQRECQIAYQELLRHEAAHGNCEH